VHPINAWPLYRQGASDSKVTCPRGGGVAIGFADDAILQHIYEGAAAMQWQEKGCGESPGARAGDMSSHAGVQPLVGRPRHAGRAVSGGGVREGLGHTQDDGEKRCRIVSLCLQRHLGEAGALRMLEALAWWPRRPRQARRA
jgi:hypothetical protein